VLGGKFGKDKYFQGDLLNDTNYGRTIIQDLSLFDASGGNKPGLFMGKREILIQHVKDPVQFPRFPGYNCFIYWATTQKN